MNAHCCSISRALPLVLLFGMVTLSCAQDGPHIIYNGPGAPFNIILNGVGGVVNQPNAMGVINPPNPPFGIPDFFFSGTLNGLPDPDPLGTGWGFVAPFVPPPGGGGPFIGPGAGADANLPFTPGGLLQLNFDPAPGNDPGTTFAPPTIIFDPNGRVIEVNGVKIPVVPLNNTSVVFGFENKPPPDRPQDEFADEFFKGLVKFNNSGSENKDATVTEAREAIRKKKDEEAKQAIADRNATQAQKLKEAQDAVGRDLKSQALYVYGDNFEGAFIPFSTLQGAVAIRNARVGELIQSLALLNLIKPGTGIVPDGSFQTVPTEDIVKNVQNLTRSIANGRKNDESRLASFLATPGVVDDENYNRLRADLLVSLYGLAQQLQLQQIALDDAKRRKDEALSQLQTALRAGTAGIQSGATASKNLDKAFAEIAAIKAEILKLLGGNALLTVPVKIGDFEGPLWQALIEFSGNTTLSQTAITEAIPLLESHIRDELVRIGGISTTDGLIREFGSPVYGPLRSAILTDKTFTTFTPASIVRGVADVQNAYAQGKTATETTDKITDAAFTIGGGIVVIGAIAFTGPLGAALVAGTGATLSAAEAGVEGYRTYVAYGDASAAESAVNAGGSVSREAAKNFDDILTGQAIVFGISSVAALVDVADVKGAVKAAREGVEETVETAATAGGKRASKNDFPKVKVDETKFTPSTVPGPNTLWTHPETGEKFLIGKKLGAGVFNTVFEIADQPGLVIKFPNKVLTPPQGANALELIQKAQEEVKELVYGSNLLAEAGIPQLKIVDANSTSNLPFVITEKLDPAKHSTVKFRDLEAGREDLIAAGKWTKEHEHAIVELYDSLAQKNLVWGDGHSDNLYFFVGPDGKLKAGVLDHDQISPLSDVADAVVHNLLVGRGLPLKGEDSAHLYALGALNAKLWIKPLDAGAGFTASFLDPNILKEFPGFAPLIAGKQLTDSAVFPKQLVTPSPSSTAPDLGRRAVTTAPDAGRRAVTFSVSDPVKASVNTSETSGTESSTPASTLPIVLPAKINEVRHQNDVQNARLPQRQPAPGRSIKLGSLIPDRQKAPGSELALAN